MGQTMALAKGHFWGLIGFFHRTFLRWNSSPVGGRVNSKVRRWKAKVRS